MAGALRCHGIFAAEPQAVPSRRRSRGAERYEVDMGKVLAGVLVVLLVLLTAAGAAIMTLDLPAPTAQVEKVIPNERVFD